MAGWFYTFSLPSASSALANINLALEQGCALSLLKALQSVALGLRGLQGQNSDWYMKQLQSDLEQKRQVGMRARLPVGFLALLILRCPPGVCVPSFHAEYPLVSSPYLRAVPTNVWASLPSHPSLQVLSRGHLCGCSLMQLFSSYSLGWRCF